MWNGLFIAHEPFNMLTAAGGRIAGLVDEARPVLKAAWDNWNAEQARPLWQPNPTRAKKGKAKKKTE